MKASIMHRRWGECELALIDSGAPADLGVRAAAGLKDMNTPKLNHRGGCICPACLYRLYYDSRQGPGRPWSKSLFFIGWLFHEARLDALVRNGQANELNCFFHAGSDMGVRLMIYKIKDYDRTPAWRAVTKILEAQADDLLDLLHAYSPRLRGAGFKKMLGAVMEKKLELLRAENAPLADAPPERSEGLKLALKVRDFIFSQPGKKATRREIQRKFNVTGAEVDAAAEWLGGFSIYQRQIAHKFQRKRGGYRNKTTVVYAVEQPVPPAGP